MSSEAELRAELERLKRENEALKTRPKTATSLKVSEKGGVSVYGLGRFPVTLYKEQWLKVLAMADDIRRPRPHDRARRPCPSPRSMSRRRHYIERRANTPERRLLGLTRNKISICSCLTKRAANIDPTSRAKL
jgi:hypothetical protein